MVILLDMQNKKLCKIVILLQITQDWQNPLIWVAREKMCDEECSREMETNGNYLGVEFLNTQKYLLELTVEVTNVRRIC